MSKENLGSHRRRKLLAGIGTGLVAYGSGITGAGASYHGAEETAATLDNVGARAWELTSVGDGTVGETGEENPTLSLQEGVRYRFTNDGWDSHPLAFRATDGEVLLSQSAKGSFEDDVDTRWDDDGDSVAFTVTSELADELDNYVCTVHASMEGSIGVATGTDPPAAVECSDQPTDGTAITVDSARMDDGGFLAIHDSSLLDGEPLESVRGVSEYLEPGTAKDLEVELDDPLVGDDVLVAMAHRDTNDDETFDFVESGGEADGPYVDGDGDAVVDDADVQVTGDAATLISDQTTDGTTVTVAFARVDDGGFLAVHDSSLFDGDPLGSVRGVSAYLDPGSYERLEVELADPLVEDDVLVAMPHRDTDGDRQYDFVESGGDEDAPYFDGDGEAVVDDADVQVTGDAATLIGDQPTDGTSVTVDFTRVDDGGFLAIHDSSLLDGEPLESVRGVSEYLEPGTAKDLEVELDDPLVGDDVLVAMAHRDTNDDETFDFVESGGEADGPYVDGDGDAVVDTAEALFLSSEATVTLDNVGARAWEVAGTDGDAASASAGQNPIVNLQRTGVRYTVENNGWDAHPLALRDEADEALLSQSGEGSFEDDEAVDWVDDGDSVAFTLTEDLAAQLDNYACTVHASMEGPIRAADVDYVTPDGGISIVSPGDGDSVEPPVDLAFEAGGFVVEPATEGVSDGRGHLHVLLDREPFAPGDYIKFEDNVLHYGGGETSVTVPASDLGPGEHTIRVQAGDANHFAYDLTDSIDITVGGTVGGYTDDEGVVQTAGLRQAIGDWRAGTIDTSLLRDVIQAWRSGNPV